MFVVLGVGIRQEIVVFWVFSSVYEFGWVVGLMVFVCCDIGSCVIFLLFWVIILLFCVICVDFVMFCLISLVWCL